MASILRSIISDTRVAVVVDAGRQGRDVGAVAQHRDAIAKPLDLVEVVRDVEDGQALGAQPRDGREQEFRLPPDERCRRLVEDEQRRPVEQRPGDLHHLLLGRGQVADQRVDRQGDVEAALERLAGVAAQAAAVDQGRPQSRGSRPTNSASATVRVGASSRSWWMM